MGLDKAFSLQKTSGASDSQANYAVPQSTTLLNEGFDAVQARFGGVGSFSEMNVGAPTFQDLSASLSLGTLPSGPAYFGSVASATDIETSTTSAVDIRAAVGGDSGVRNDHLVKLVSTVDGSGVIFDIMPEVSESRSAEYEPLAASQMPGEFQKYKGTKATTWQITAKFTCRTRSEAKEKYLSLNALRAWTMPYFGEAQSGSRLGAPPPVLMFSGWRGVVGPVPTVLTSLNWQWPSECDWIPTGIFVNEREVPFPTVMTVQFTLIESFSATQFNNFDLNAFRAGLMIEAFSSTPVQGETPPVAEPVVVGAGAGAGRGLINEKPGEREEYLRTQASKALNYVPAVEPQSVDTMGIVTGYVND